MFQVLHVLLLLQVGEIWPNDITEATITFAPKAAGLHRVVAYLEVAGLQERVALRITAEALGAKLAFSYDSLDIGHVFLGTEHSYEVC